MENTSLQLETFAEGLIAQAGFDKLPDKFRQDFKEQIMNEALQRLGMLLAAELTPEQLQAYERLFTASADPTADPAISQFISSNVPDFAAKSAAVLKSYGEEFLSEAQKALGK